MKKLGQFMTGCQADIKPLFGDKFLVMETTDREGLVTHPLRAAGTRKTYFIIHFVLNFHTTRGNPPKSPSVRISLEEREGNKIFYRELHSVLGHNMNPKNKIEHISQV